MRLIVKATSALRSIAPSKCAIPYSFGKRTCCSRPSAQKGTHFVNTTDGLVTEAIDGLVLSCAHLSRLDGYPDVKVVHNNKHDKKKVAIISGGGSGHEPMHAGYVGEGMLTAAVCGDVFASPSAEAVLAAIRTVAGPAGCLLVVKNYTGDRLHFGLALEQAKSEGYKVEMVVVGEDVAIDMPGMAGRRGLAGTVFVHKVSGAVAHAGGSLEEVVAAAQKVADGMATLGVAVLPSEGSVKEVEFGLGIHGEPGFTRAPMQALDDLVGDMLFKLTSLKFAKVKSGQRAVLMVNNLGGTSVLEMQLVVHSAVNQLAEKHKISIERIYVGTFCTSLDMPGFSLTLLDLEADEQLTTWLDAPVGVSGWTSVGGVLDLGNKVTPVPKDPREHDEVASAGRPSQLTPQGQLLDRCIRAAAEKLVEAAPQLNEWDAAVGDGDCGSTLEKGARAILADLGVKFAVNDAVVAVGQLGASVRHSIGGTSGALYDVFLTAAAGSLKANGSETSLSWATALAAGVAAVQKYGGATRGCRTMVDALLPAAEAAVLAASQGATPAEVATAAAAAAEAGANDTVNMVATAGRSSYVPVEVMHTVPDPGAKAAAMWISAIANVMKE